MSRVVIAASAASLISSAANASDFKGEVYDDQAIGACDEDIAG